MDPKLFYELYPRLYHMAHKDALHGILRHGLLSTSALLSLFEIRGEQRKELETRMRVESVRIDHPIHGRAVIRDQKPIMNDARLAKALHGTATASEWHRLLNSKVFFWVNESRLKDLRNAVTYKSDPQLVLTLDTRRVVEAAIDRIWLCPMNSGACKPMPHPRSPAIFQRIADFDLNYWARKRRSAKKAVVECAIDGELKNIEPLLLSTEVIDIENESSRVSP